MAESTNLSPVNLSPVNPPSPSAAPVAAALLLQVTQRLFVSIFCLVLVAAAVMSYAVYSKSPYLLPFAVVLSGCLGGFVGLQRRLKSLTIQDLELIAKSYIYTWLSPLVGGVLAILLYIFFLSELLAGPLFPGFKPDTIEGAATGFASIFEQQAKQPPQDYAKLVFWCFVAGFSERFVTDVIGRFEGTAVKNIK